MTDEPKTAEVPNAKAVWTAPELIDLNHGLDDVHGASGIGGDASGQAS